MPGLTGDRVLLQDGKAPVSQRRFHKHPHEAADEVVIVPPHAMDPDRTIPPQERGPGLIFVPVPEGKEFCVLSARE